MTSYARRKAHPPIFAAVARKANPYGAVAGLSRAIAHKEAQADKKLQDELNRLLRVGKHREPDYSERWKYAEDPWETDPADRWGSPEGYNE